MVLTYKQCIEKYGSDHMLKKEIAEGNIFQKEKGIYSLNRTCSELEVIGKLHACFFYYFTIHEYKNQCKIYTLASFSKW